MTTTEENRMTTEEDSMTTAEATRLWEVTVQRDELQRQLAAMRDQLVATSALLERSREQQLALSNTHDSLESRLIQAQQAQSRAESALDNFKEQVVDVASRFATEHGWCSVIDEALEELGLKRKPKTYSAKLTITVDFTAGLSSGRSDTPSESWVRDSVQFEAIRRAIQHNFQMDSDHESASVDQIEYDVEDVEVDED
jgi:hypothetical protein